MAAGTSARRGLGRLGLVSLCVFTAILIQATEAHAEDPVTVTYVGQMVSFRTTGSAEKLFGHYLIEVSWTESTSVAPAAVDDFVLDGTPLPPLNWTLDSLTGKVHEDELGDPLPPEKECTATLSPRPGFSESVDYTAGSSGTNLLLKLKAKPAFLAGSFVSSIEEESSFCSASAVHTDGKQAVGPPESDASAYAEYLAAYEPALTVPIESGSHATPFNYSYTFENPPKLMGEQAYVKVNSTITVDGGPAAPPFTVNFPGGNPIEPAKPIPLIERSFPIIEPPPYYLSHPPSSGTGAKDEEKTPPLELEPVDGSIKGWTLRCPKALVRCQAKAVLTAREAKVEGGKTARTPSRFVVIGSANVIAAGGRQAPINARLSRKGAALLRARKRLRCTLTITATAPGIKKPARGSWTLELRRPRHR